MSEGSKKTILLVDDEAIITLLQKNILEDYGYKVITAGSGLEAIEIFKSDSSIDLVLMDIDLGKGMDGTDTAIVMLRERDIPVVFLSNHIEPEIVRKTEKITSYGYVVKNSGDAVLDMSMKMAFRLFDEKMKNKTKDKLLCESEERYRTLVESQLEAVCIWLPDTTLTFVNEAYCLLMGKSKEELTGVKWIEFIPESSRYEVMENYRKAVVARRVYSYVHEVEAKDGIRWYRWNDVPLFNEEGNLKEFQSVGHDITERKQAEDRVKSLLLEKELLLKEMHHRIKNNMNTLYALLMLQAESLKDSSAVSALNDAGNRVQSMSLLYDKLYSFYDFNEMPVVYYLSSLINEIVENFPNGKSVKIEKKFDDFVLEVNKLQPLGIIINELITNIMKYAFHGMSDRQITVSATLKGGNVTVLIADNGIGIPESMSFENSPGFGMQLVNMLTKQIGANIRIERNGGTRFVLEFQV